MIYELPILIPFYDSGCMDTWESQDGTVRLMSEMDTQHVFYSFMMLWNHMVEEKYQLWKIKTYYFSKELQNSCKEKINQLYVELRKRNDLGTESVKVLNQIESWNGLDAYKRYHKLRGLYEK